MVCEKCQKKQATVICPDKWKEGARNTTESGGRKLNENKLLSKAKRFNPLTAAARCKVCKQHIPRGNLYCHGCAYKNGVCAMCGKKTLDTTFYRQSMK